MRTLRKLFFWGVLLITSPVWPCDWISLALPYSLSQIPESHTEYILKQLWSLNQTVYELDDTIASRSEEQFRQLFENEWDKDLSQVFISPVGQVVGFLFVEQNLTKSRAFIPTIAVLPKFRRKGIAKKLLHGFAQRALAYEIATTALNVKTDNAAAISMYQGFGFVIVTTVANPSFFNTPAGERNYQVYRGSIETQKLCQLTEEK